MNQMKQQLKLVVYWLICWQPTRNVVWDDSYLRVFNWNSWRLGENILHCAVSVVGGEYHHAELCGRTINFANPPPCVCHGSTGQKP